MFNAKKEFLSHIDASGDVKCATVQHIDVVEPILLPVGYTEEQFDAFLEALNFEYYNGYGGQELFGTIWYEDGTWADRGEYDGSEWWEHHSCPPIPVELQTEKSEA